MVASSAPIEPVVASSTPIEPVVASSTPVIEPVVAPSTPVMEPVDVEPMVAPSTPVMKPVDASRKPAVDAASSGRKPDPVRAVSREKVHKFEAPAVAEARRLAAQQLRTKLAARKEQIRWCAYALCSNVYNI